MEDKFMGYCFIFLLKQVIESMIFHHIFSRLIIYAKPHLTLVLRSIVKLVLLQNQVL